MSQFSQLEQSNDECTSAHRTVCEGEDTEAEGQGQRIQGFMRGVQWRTTGFRTGGKTAGRSKRASGGSGPPFPPMRLLWFCYGGRYSGGIEGRRLGEGAREENQGQEVACMRTESNVKKMGQGKQGS